MTTKRVHKITRNRTRRQAAARRKGLRDETRPKGMVNVCLDHAKPVYYDEADCPACILMLEVNMPESRKSKKIVAR